MSKNILIGFVVLILAAAAVYYYFVLRQPSAEPLEREAGLGSELLQNPGTLVPETNPFQNTDTNPLKGANPFEGGYRNPFE
jgi:hypothetical protein